MFNTLKKFFGKRGGATMDAPSETDQADSFAPPIPSSPRAVRVDALPAPAARPGSAPSNVAVPLKSIIGKLPADLMQRVRQVDVGDAEICIPTQKILAQISTGAVRISFGELRQLAPAGTFTAENDRDRTLVELPLYEILARLNPGLLLRRPAQQHVEVPAEVVGPFGGQTKVTISNTPVKPAAPAAHPAARPVVPTPSIQAPMRAQPPVAAPVQPAPRSQPPIVPAQPMPAPRIQPSVVPMQPVFARIRPSTPVPRSAPVQPVAAVAAPLPEMEMEAEAPIFTRANFAPPPPPAPVYSPIANTPAPKPSGDTDIIQMPENYRPQPPVSAPITPIAPEAEVEPEPIRFSAPPQAPEPPAAPVAPVMPTTSGETRFITASLAELSEGWPEALRNEIAANKISGSWVGLPLGAVEGIIKTGKISFPWKALRSWVKPPIPSAPSPYDTTMLTLPLKVITPLFMAELKANRAQTKFAVDEDIPDLFFNSQPVENVVSLPAPPAHPAPVAPLPPPPTPTPAYPSFPAKAESARPADTNYFVWKDTTEQAEEAEQPEVFVKQGSTTPGTAFLNRYATPNEIVSKTASLNGVDGALIALPDGLLVASKIPTNMNADTIAAFLPQIFGRVSQCTRELRLGELNNLNFTVGNIPWKIFRVGSIYFAAFGRPGVPLPTAQLVGLAAELDRKAK